jgi:eukaryotic-like serine/threonine-protein kinase
MTLAPGTRLGSYEVSTLIGEGGMGQVYRARDTRLHRDVALKIVPPLVAGDPERLARFDREAQTLAALNHPHIAQVYGIEETRQGGASEPPTRAIVMELVDGEDLAERIARGAVPPDEALPIARQIAEALEAAHDAGIVHRDLKPANIKVRPDGTVKVLDFGLAKALDAAPASGASGGQGTPALANSPTITSPAPMTAHGVILGTAAYMAPEQARGRPVDKRADIWAFGCVLYEMLAGRTLFGGETISDTLAAVLTRAPDWTTLPSTTPVAVVALLARCLEREPKRRLRDIGEARLALESGAAQPASGAVPATPTAPRPRFVPAAAMLAGVALGVAASALGLWLAPDPPAPSPIVLHQLPPPGTEFVAAPLPSPQGTHLALLVRASDGRRAIWVRPLAGEHAREIEGTGGAETVMWSPDGAHLAFSAKGHLQRVPRDGGRVQTIAAVEPVSRSRNYRVGAWTPGGEIVIAAPQGLVRVPAGGGMLRPILQAEGVIYEAVNVLGNGTHLLYAEFGGKEPGIYTVAIDGSDRRSLLQGEVSGVSVVAPDVIVFQRRETLYGQVIDPAARTTIGDPFALTDGVAAQRVEAGPGVLAYIRAGLQTELTWFDRGGQRLGTIGAPGRYQQLRLSPAGTELLFVRLDPATGNRDLWLQDLVRGVTSRLTHDPETDHNGVFSPDGRHVAWESHAGGRLDLYRRPVDGSAPPTLLLDWGRANGPVDWSPDGRYILFASDDGPTRENLWMVRADGSEKPQEVLASPYSEEAASFSPDGRHLAFTSDESGRSEVYVQAIAGTRLVGGRVQVSSGGGAEPAWRRDGRELYYGGEGRLMAVSIARDGDAIRAGTPVALFAAMVSARSYGTVTYAPSPDGQRFVFITPVGGGGATTPATVVLNWRRDEQP